MSWLGCDCENDTGVGFVFGNAWPFRPQTSIIGDNASISQAVKRGLEAGNQVIGIGKTGRGKERLDLHGGLGPHRSKLALQGGLGSKRGGLAAGTNASAFSGPVKAGVWVAGLWR